MVVRVVERTEWDDLAMSTQHCLMCRVLADWATGKLSAQRKSTKSWGHGRGVLAGRKLPACSGRSAGKRIGTVSRLAHWKKNKTNERHFIFQSICTHLTWQINAEQTYCNGNQNACPLTVSMLIINEAVVAGCSLNVCSMPGHQLAAHLLAPPRGYFVDALVIRFAQQWWNWNNFEGVSAQNTFCSISFSRASLFYCLDFSRYSWTALLRAFSQPFLLPLSQCWTLLIPADSCFLSFHLCSPWEHLFSIHTRSACGFKYALDLFTLSRGGPHTVHPHYTYNSAVLWGNAIDVSIAATSAVCLTFHSAHILIYNHVAQL